MSSVVLVRRCLRDGDLYWALSGLGREGVSCGRFLGQSATLHALACCAHSLPRSSPRARQARSPPQEASPHQLRSQNSRGTRRAAKSGFSKPALLQRCAAKREATTRQNTTPRECLARLRWCDLPIGLSAMRAASDARIYHRASSDPNSIAAQRRRRRSAVRSTTPSHRRPPRPC